jgi:hypothetical protein
MAHQIASKIGVTELNVLASCWNAVSGPASNLVLNELLKRRLKSACR